MDSEKEKAYIDKGKRVEKEVDEVKVSNQLESSEKSHLEETVTSSLKDAGHDESGKII